MNLKDTSSLLPALPPRHLVGQTGPQTHAQAGLGLDSHSTHARYRRHYGT